jgi:hypothetical protein
MDRLLEMMDLRRITQSAERQLWAASLLSLLQQLDISSLTQLREMQLPPLRS